MSLTDTQELDAWNCAALVQLCLLSRKSTSHPPPPADHYLLFPFPDSHGIMTIQAALHGGKKKKKKEAPWHPGFQAITAVGIIRISHLTQSFIVTRGLFCLLFNPYNNHLREGSTSQIRNWGHKMWGDMSKVTQLVSARGAYRRIQGQEELALLLEVSRLGPADSEGPQIPAPDCVS